MTEKQADRQLYFGAYFSKTMVSLGMGGTLILSYISRFGPLLEVQNFEFHLFCFFVFLGGQKNKLYVLGYDEIMNIFFVDFLGSHFYTF